MNQTKKSTFPYLATIIALIAIVIMIGLGFWQLDRKHEKEMRLDNIKKAAESGEMAIEDISKDLVNYQDYQVRLSGKQTQQFFFIDNMLKDGQAGYHVLLPYQTNVGVVMVNLGWLPSTGIRSELPKLSINLPNSLQGIVYIPTDNTLVKETNQNYGSFPVLLQQIDLQEIEKHLGLDVLPVTIRLLADQSEFVREWQKVTMSPEKHLGYAIQWFGLAIAALTVYLLSLLKWMNISSTEQSTITNGD